MIVQNKPWVLGVCTLVKGNDKQQLQQNKIKAWWGKQKCYRFT